VRYQIVAEAYRDLEAASGRLQMIERLAELFRQTPDDLLPTVALLCQGQIAPDFAEVELGMAERLAARAVAQAVGAPAEQVNSVGRSHRAALPVVITSEIPGSRASACSASANQPAVTRARAIRHVPGWSSAIAHSLA